MNMELTAEFATAEDLVRSARVATSAARAYLETLLARLDALDHAEAVMAAERGAPAPEFPLSDGEDPNAREALRRLRVAEDSVKLAARRLHVARNPDDPGYPEGFTVAES